MRIIGTVRVFPVTIIQTKNIVWKKQQHPLFRSLLKGIKKDGEVHIVLDCSTEKILPFLKQAMQVGMMTAYHNYLITSLDLHMVDLEDFKYGGTNVTAFRLLDPDRAEVRQVVEDWMYGEMRFGRNFDAAGHSIKVIYSQKFAFMINLTLKPSFVSVMLHSTKYDTTLIS